MTAPSKRRRAALTGARAAHFFLFSRLLAYLLFGGGFCQRLQRGRFHQRLRLQHLRKVSVLCNPVFGAGCGEYSSGLKIEGVL
jgi:hypothetical protein